MEGSIITTHDNFVARLTTKKLQFRCHSFPQIATLMEIFEGNPWKIAENRTLKRVSSHPEQEAPFP
jgi:hypothetical protein